MAEKKDKGGQPLKWDNPESLDIKIEDYFKECDEKKLPYTITGLCLALDTNRQTLLNYQEWAEIGWLKRVDEETRKQYVDTIKKAKLKCENYAEMQLFRTSQVAGVIFNMKNNYGYRDVSEVINTNPEKDLSIEEIEAQLKQLESKDK